MLEKTLRVPWAARRSHQSILKEINPGISLEGMMLKLKLQYFGHFMRRVDSLEKTLMLGGVGGRRHARPRRSCAPALPTGSGPATHRDTHRTRWWAGGLGPKVPGPAEKEGRQGSWGTGGTPGDSADAERMVAAVRTGQGREQLGLAR